MKEKNYEFRKRLETVHRPDRRKLAERPAEDELMIETGWCLAIDKKAAPVVCNVAKDLQDYFLVSMNISVLLEKVGDIQHVAREGKQKIILATKKELSRRGAGLSVAGSYRIVCSREQVVVCGADARGVGQASYYLEDLMNLREAPILRKMDITRRPTFSPRMTHSGWGLDQFPDNYLNLIAHAGMDSIIVFVTDVNKTPLGYQDFNSLVDRAALFGLDVYFYSFLKSLKHPDETCAEAYYEGTYGKIFKQCPRAKGVILVGESCEFPSKDPHTTRALRLTPPADGLPSLKPSPGWWPCRDFPKWLNLIKKVVRRYSPDADIVFWTYNWGWAPKAARLKLIRSIPKDITLLVTFETCKQIKKNGLTNLCLDYTVAAEGPSESFTSEAKAAHQRGLKLYTMSNTGGLTWDFGVIPYEPVPFQWARRFRALLKCQARYGLTGLMESHHYGWWPSLISELAKWTYWSPGPSFDEAIKSIARRDFGSKGAQPALAAWADWSRAIRDYVVTAEDQYGPFRIGPSYPLIFHPNYSMTYAARDLNLPSVWHAMYAQLITFTYYQPFENEGQSPFSTRVEAEIRAWQNMAARWRRGMRLLEKAVRAAPKGKRLAGQRLLALGQFILNSVFTTIHVKQWWQLNRLLMMESNPKKSNIILDSMVRLAEQEIANAQATIPLAEMDSRLGWEPSLEYMTDKAHLEWKIRQVRRVLDDEIPRYRQSLRITKAV